MAKKEIEAKRKHYKKSEDEQGRASIQVRVRLTREEVEFAEKKAEWIEVTVADYLAICAVQALQEEMDAAKE